MLQFCVGRHSFDLLVSIRHPQGRLLALKAKLTEQVSLLDSERRFINARAAALQNKADQLQARLRTRWQRCRRD